MKNVKVYKQIEKDCQYAEEIVKALNLQLDEIGRIKVTSSLDLYSGCSESSFLFAVGVLDSRITASKALGVPDTEMVDLRQQVLDLYKLDKEYDEWNKYYSDLRTYKGNFHRLLTAEEKIELLEKPVPPGK